MDIATIATVGGALFALLSPVYAALWKVNGDLGRIEAKTSHNETAVEKIGDAVSRIEEAVAESEAVDLPAAES